MKKVLLALSFIVLSSTYVMAQSAIDSRIQEVYGNIASQLTPEQINWQNNCLERSVVMATNEVPQGVSLAPLSSVPMLEKFQTLTPDAVYNAATFNPLKYALNFFMTTDQYFAIDDNHVLKVKKKTAIN